MKYILILLVSFAFGQTPNMTYIDGQWYGAEELKEKEMQEIKEYLFGTEMPIGIPMPIGGKDLWYIDDNGITSKVITRGDILEYAEECYGDTIKEYWLDNYEVQELNRQGYYFTYRPSSNRKELIFVKRPSFEGFIEWIKK